MLTKSWRILNLNHVLKHCHISFILFVLLVKQINLLKFITTIIIIHVHNIVLRLSFFFEKLVAIEIVLLHEFIDVWCCVRLYTRLITYIIDIAKTPTLQSYSFANRLCLGCLRLQIRKVPKEFLTLLILVFSGIIV